MLFFFFSLFSCQETKFGAPSPLFFGDQTRPVAFILMSLLLPSIFLTKYPHFVQLTTGKLSCPHTNPSLFRFLHFTLSVSFSIQDSRFPVFGNFPDHTSF
ncbi:hypothetical protein Dimus_009564 [Dionaea muscipula]